MVLNPPTSVSQIVYLSFRPKNGGYYNNHDLGNGSDLLYATNTMMSRETAPIRRLGTRLVVN
jgi:hypothetical protein